MPRKKPAPEVVRTTKHVRCAIIAFRRDGAARWLHKDQKALIPDERRDQRWEGHPQDAALWVMQAHAAQALSGVWPEISHFDTRTFVIDLPEEVAS